MRDGNPRRRHPRGSGGEPPPWEEVGREQSWKKDGSANALERKSQNYQKARLRQLRVES